MRLTTLRKTAVVVSIALGVMSAMRLQAVRLPPSRAERASASLAGAFGVGGKPDTTLQVPEANAQAFEVASVKPNKSGDGRAQIGMRPGGQFTATNVPLRMLIRNAYGIQDVQLMGGPDWIGSDRFDIIAKAEGDVAPSPPGTPGPMQFMLRTLLAERFKLAVHNETREPSIYALVIARSDGKLGPKLRPATVDCAAMMAAARARGGQPPPPAPGQPMPCGMRIGPGVMNAGSFPLSQLAVTLSTMVNRTVLDRTGLTGNFDFDLEFTGSTFPARPARAASRCGAAAGRPERPIDLYGAAGATRAQARIAARTRRSPGD